MCSSSACVADKFPGFGGARLAKDVTTGVLDCFRSLSIWRGALVLGGPLGDVGRRMLAAAIVVILGVIIGYRPHGGAPGVIAAAALVIASGLSQPWLWAATALAVRAAGSASVADDRAG